MSYFLTSAEEDNDDDDDDDDDDGDDEDFGKPKKSAQKFKKSEPVANINRSNARKYRVSFTFIDIIILAFRVLNFYDIALVFKSMTTHVSYH